MAKRSINGQKLSKTVLKKTVKNGQKLLTTDKTIKFVKKKK